MRAVIRPLLVLSLVVPLTACGRDSTTAPTAAAVTFGLVGGVSDAAGRPLAQARVEAVSGPQKGAVAVTDDAGGFAFGPIFTSPFILRAAKEGHRNKSREISTAQSDGFFKLEIDLGGPYEVTFSADAACTRLPAAVRIRIYSASFGWTAESFYLATLGGADFARGSSTSASYPDYNVMYVNVVADVATVNFSDPEIWEHLPPGTDLSPDTDLVIIGAANGTVGAETSHWPFAGTFTYCPAPESEAYPECNVPVISCHSQNHQLTLTRTR